MAHVRQLCSGAAIALTFALSTGACILAGNGETSPEGSASSSTGSAGSGGDTASSSSSSAAGGSGAAGGSTGSGGNSTSETGPGPSQDLAPDAQAPGPYVCDGCPEAMIDLGDADAGSETLFDISGKVSGEVGHGKFIVINDAGQYSGGGLLVDDSTGDFAQTIPLFCGNNLVKMFFENASGRSAFVRSVLRKSCLADDVRVTVAWDETTRHWGTHLVRFGGTINDHDSDCDDKLTCYPGSSFTDWGIAGSKADDPVQDLSMNYVEMGVENIYYPGAEDGLTVLVDNQDDFGSVTPNGTLYINVHDQPTYVRQLEALQPKHVYIAAEVDGAAGGFTWVDEDYDCNAEWESGDCLAALP